MSSVEGHKPIKYPAMRPYLVVKLKQGWRYDARRGRFASDSDSMAVPRQDLPKWTRIVHMTPDLAGKPEASLSAQESNLARYVHILLPRGSRPEKVLPYVKGWKCIDEASLPTPSELP